MRRKSVLDYECAAIELAPEIRSIVEKHGIVSLWLFRFKLRKRSSACISWRLNRKGLRTEDVVKASAFADFTAIALENAGLFAELQRSAITDSLTGVYNTRFFHEVLGRETARADRYSSPCRF